jgi:hypothetical protein
MERLGWWAFIVATLASGAHAATISVTAPDGDSVATVVLRDR